MRATLPLALLGFSCLLGSVGAESTTPASPVVSDVLKLAKAKVDESVIMAYVEKTTRGNISAADLLSLHSNGISSRVLVALLETNPTEVSPAVAEQAPDQPVPQSIAGSTDAIAATYVTAPVVEPPLVQYVSEPVYVGGGSIYYQEDGWWGIGLGISYWGWTGWYPWYGFGWYPYYGHGGYYAHCGYYSYGHHHHHGNHHNGHGNHGHGNHYNGHAANHWHSGGQVHRNNAVLSRNAGRSTVAGAGGNQSRGVTAATRTASGVATRTQATATRGGTTTTSANVSGRNAGNNVNGGGRTAVAPSGNTATRSQVARSNGRTTTTSLGQQSGVRSGLTASSGATRAVAVPGSGQQSATVARRSYAAPGNAAPSSVRPGVSGPTAVTRYAQAPSARPSFQGGVSRPSGSQVSPAFRGGFSAPRSAATPSATRGFSGGGRSYAGVSRGFSGGGSRSVAGGGGGRSFGGGGRGFGGGGGGGRR